MIEKFILAYGTALRLIYVLFSTIYDRQYDIGAISLDAGHIVSGGHLAYIQTLYENLRLPDVDPSTVYQFHHPPLHHYLCALWMRLMSLFIRDNGRLQESMQAVPFFFSVLTLFFLYRILKEFEREEYALWIALGIAAVHPSLIQLSGSVNNDGTALAFTVLVVYYMIRWFRHMSLKNILLAAVFLGLGISAKQNVAELAFPIGICFVIVLVEKFRGGNIMIADGVGIKSRTAVIWELLMQYAAFGIVSVPLGMWFYIRNLVRYHMSILWVYELPRDSWQYTGNMPVVNRFLWPVFSEFFHNLASFKLGCGYNVWMQIMRTSVLGEWDMASAGKGVKILAVFLMFTGAALACMACVSFFRVFAAGQKRKKGRAGFLYDTGEGMLMRVFFLTGYAVTMIFYLVFVYKYPYECSMNFRYITVTLLFMAAGISADRELSERKGEMAVYFVLLAGFALSSTVMTVVWIAGR